jgi:branched-subunit amino acid aminotransferase/4-amino-4-deoxychorismate lyase
MAGAVELSVDGAPASPDDLTHVALVNYGAYTSFRVEQGGARGLDLHLARLEAEAVELFGEPVGETRLRDLMRAAAAGQPVFAGDRPADAGLARSAEGDDRGVASASAAGRQRAAAGPNLCPGRPPSEACGDLRPDPRPPVGAS